MKNLPQFQPFDWEKFIEGKAFTVTGCSPWKDFNTKEVCGTSVDTVITVDKTPYIQKDGVQVTNKFEKLSFKIRKTVNVPIDSIVLPVDPVVTVYGEYRNNLSVKADDIKILQPASQGQPQTQGQPQPLRRKE